MSEGSSDLSAMGFYRHKDLALVPHRTRHIFTLLLRWLNRQLTWHCTPHSTLAGHFIRSNVTLNVTFVVNMVFIANIWGFAKHRAISMSSMLSDLPQAAMTQHLHATQIPGY